MDRERFMSETASNEPTAKRTLFSTLGSLLGFKKDKDNVTELMNLKTRQRSLTNEQTGRIYRGMVGGAGAGAGRADRDSTAPSTYTSGKPTITTSKHVPTYESNSSDETQYPTLRDKQIYEEFMASHIDRRKKLDATDLAALFKFTKAYTNAEISESEPEIDEIESEPETAGEDDNDTEPVEMVIMNKSGAIARHKHQKITKEDLIDILESKDAIKQQIMEADFEQMEEFYMTHYTLASLYNIADYYGLRRRVLKPTMVQDIVLYETNIDNFEKVYKRRKMWAYLEELKEDKFLSKYISIQVGDE